MISARPSKSGWMGTGRKHPIEYSILYTATLCLLAVGAVMVYSASSAESLLAGSGDPSQYLKRYVVFGLLGLVALHYVSRHGLKVVRAVTPLLLIASFGLTVLVMIPGFGVTVNGATRWLGAGPLQFQPSELLKLALVLYAAQLLAARPRAVQSVGGLFKPLLIVVGAACLLLLIHRITGEVLLPQGLPPLDRRPGHTPRPLPRLRRDHDLADQCLAGATPGDPPLDEQV